MDTQQMHERMDECSKRLERATSYVKRKDFHSAIKEYIKVSEISSQLERTALKENMPSVFKLTYANLTRTAYLGCVTSYEVLGMTQESDDYKSLLEATETRIKMYESEGNVNTHKSNEESESGCFTWILVAVIFLIIKFFL